MSKRLDVDWTVVKAAYVSSNKTTAQLAEEFGLHVEAVESQCTRGRWVNERRKLTEAAERAAMEKLVTERLKAIEQMNKNHITLAKTVQAAASAKLRKSLVKDQAGEIVDCNLAAKDLAAIATANLTSTKQERTAHGLNSESIGSDVQINTKATASGMGALQEILDELSEAGKPSEPEAE